MTVFDREFLDPLLVIECNFDGGLEDFLAAFARKAGGLEALLNCRIGAPVQGPQEVIAALRAGAVKPSAGHIGAIGLSRDEIESSEALVAQVRQHLGARQTDLIGADASVVAAELQRTFSARCPPLKPRRTMAELAAAWGPTAVVVGLLLSPAIISLARWTAKPLAAYAILAILAVLAAVIFLWAERRESVRERPQGREDLAALKENRPGTVQNHFSSIAPLKTGPVRWASQRAFMFLLNQMARLKFTKGELGGIPSIHFAHWAVLDEGASLLFVSNYGGTWEAYLDDFVQQAADGLTGVWSHCVGFPASRWLVKGGARDERAFKRYARDSQAAEAVWYTAYPHLTTRRINNNRAIVEALAGRSKEPPERWLARI